ncbi:CGNR zinc finger domain-containing protein [Luteibacter anthropi]|uniref:CGNR zinc finger domain-containing protein n=1 Tax=Luteibacter anthropi TaxID=564369 RepID=UPI002032B856|nr:CGNR zinc finger domain-containing protein [Luteibacter anthropi]URX62303.1 CGNR zinc finger domain-containing protein [Luteibacter anthropi]
MNTVDIPAPLFLGDDLALDFINSAYGVGEAYRDHFDSSQGVIRWLEAAGLPVRTLAPEAGAALQRTALDLRTCALSLVEKRKRDERGNPETLNRVLSLGQAWHELVWERDEAPSLVLRQGAHSPEALLLPVAEALGALLANADFHLVRQCEGDACTLWFHDRTKAHHRRWCSQATCGNRMKVAAYRARKRG